MKKYLSVNDIIEKLSLSKSSAYRIVNEFREELSRSDTKFQSGSYLIFDKMIRVEEESFFIFVKNYQILKDESARDRFKFN